MVVVIEVPIDPASVRVKFDRLDAASSSSNSSPESVMVVRGIKKQANGNSLNKLRPCGRAEIYTKFERLGASVEASGVHNEAERDQPAHIQFMCETSSNR